MNCFYGFEELAIMPRLIIISNLVESITVGEGISPVPITSLIDWINVSSTTSLS
jgi:hypothetical protein